MQKVDQKDRLLQTVKIMLPMQWHLNFILQASGSQPYLYIRITHGDLEKYICSNMTFRVTYVVVLRHSPGLQCFNILTGGADAQPDFYDRAVL